MYISVPFYLGRLNTVRRAIVKEGQIVHLLEPQYHGNPIDPENGSLVFYDYGWDFLSMLKTTGFGDAYIIRNYSPYNGNIAPVGIFFVVAEKC